MLPLLRGIFHPGMWVPLPGFLVLALSAAFPDKIKALLTGRFRIAARIAAAGLALGALLIMALCVLMAIAATRAPPEDTEVTVVVLGCQVHGTTPSLMLSRRINAAYEYLEANPNASCIASGGQGPGEDITEAQAIRDVLVGKGIDENRIFLEDTSTSTLENIGFSAQVIREHGLPRQVAVASDNFHQFRAHGNARKEGLEPYALSCWAPWWLGPGYWVREAIAIVWHGVMS
jgi:uncharacterized SAM-binding protein YcdF (DUF218 family)